MIVSGLNHINIRTSDLDSCKAFYEGVLGLAEGYRPPFDSPGAWLYAGDAPVVHISIESQEVTSPGGAIDHYAFSVKGFDATIKRLEEAKIAFRTFQVPDNPARQIFVQDPDGVTVELNFPDGT
jgi:catechol 2,3-dioxygenase-like lactoylglutathione lyase family enzyme